MAFSARSAVAVVAVLLLCAACHPSLLASAAPLGENRTCTGTVQPSLRFNVSGRKAADYLPYSFPPGESLVEAICCDSAFEMYAEPPFFFERPDVDLFGKLPTNGSTTVFYDPFCGIPLFIAPVGRTVAEWKQESEQHSWPSFRDGEAILDNVYFEGTRMFSKCGTHLGDRLADTKGTRYCIDLICISGLEKK